MAFAISGVANNVALIAAHQGAFEVARKLCSSHVRWQVRLSRRSGDLSLGGHALQPWINLGRLEALTGSWQAALARFAQLRGCRPGSPIKLDRARVPGEGWQVLGDTIQDALRFVERAYVVESLKALLLNRRYADVLVFNEALTPDDHPGRSRLVIEATIVAAVGQGDFDRARKTAAAALGQTAAWERLTFQLRLAETLACTGAADRAGDLLHPIVRAAMNLSPATWCELQPLYVLARVAAVAREIGLEREAAAMAQRALDGARTARDEVFQLNALRILAAVTTGDEHCAWKDSLDRLERVTEYQRERRNDAKTPPGPALTGLYARLDEVLAV
jgi:hypothetical protein